MLVALEFVVENGAGSCPGSFVYEPRNTSQNDLKGGTYEVEGGTSEVPPSTSKMQPSTFYTEHFTFDTEQPM
jgi:hypothetical protein